MIDSQRDETQRVLVVNCVLSLEAVCYGRRSDLKKRLVLRAQRSMGAHIDILFGSGGDFFLSTGKFWGSYLRPEQADFRQIFEEISKIY